MRACFRRRFLALSGVMHAAPLALPLALPSLSLRDCEEPVPREVRAVVLLDMGAMSAAAPAAKMPMPESEVPRPESAKAAPAATTARERNAETTPAEEATPMVPAPSVGAPHVPVYFDGLALLAGMAVGVAPSAAPRVDARRQEQTARQEQRPAPAGAQPAQDRERAIAAIAERLAKVLPLVFWDEQRKREVVGVTVVRLRLNRYGYVEWSQVSGDDARLVPASYAALHLAEPFIYVSGVIEIELKFYG